MDENKLIKYLVVIVSSIIGLNIINEILGGQSWQITRLIHVGYENNFPTWFSSILLAIAACFAYKCSLIENIEQNQKRMWQLLSLVLLGMSCDEVAQIHEHLCNVINKYFFDFQLYSLTLIILGPFIFLVTFVFALKIKKYLKDSRKVKKLLLMGTIIYIGSAVVLENMFNFLDYATVWIVTTEQILEESGKMFGVILIIKGLAEYYKTMKFENGAKRKFGFISN